MKTWQAILLTLAIVAINILILPEFIGFLIVLGTAVWCAVDSKKLVFHKYNTKIAHKPVWIFIFCVLIWIYAFPKYLVERHKIRNGITILKPEYADSEPSSDQNEKVTLEKTPYEISCEKHTARQPWYKPDTKKPFKLVLLGLAACLILMIGLVCFDVKWYEGEHLIKVMSSGERTRLMKNGMVEIITIPDSIILNKPEWFDSVSVNMPIDITSDEFMQFIELEYGQYGTNEWKKCIKAYYYVIEQYPEAAFYARQTISYYYTTQNDFYRAIAEMETAIPLIPDTSTKKDLETASSLFYLGYCYTMSGRYEEAKEVLARCSAYQGNDDYEVNQFAKKAGEILPYLLEEKYWHAVHEFKKGW